jgi:nitroreductase
VSRGSQVGPWEGRSIAPGGEVDEVTLRRLLAAAGRAPSAYDLQPWRFLVVREAASRKRLAGAAFGQSILAEAPVVVVVLGYPQAHRTHLDLIVEQRKGLGILDDAEAREFAALASRTASRWPDARAWALRTGMLAVAELLRAAPGEGLAAVLVEDFDHEKIRKTVGIPDDHVLCAIVAVGVAGPPLPNSGRLGLEETCFAEHFGQPWSAEGGE